MANPMAKEFVVLNAGGFESRLEDGHRCQHEEEPLDPKTYSNKHGKKGQKLIVQLFTAWLETNQVNKKIGRGPQT